MQEALRALPGRKDFAVKAGKINNVIFGTSFHATSPSPSLVGKRTASSALSSDDSKYPTRPSEGRTTTRASFNQTDLDSPDKFRGSTGFPDTPQAREVTAAPPAIVGSGVVNNKTTGNRSTAFPQLSRPQYAPTRRGPLCHRCQQYGYADVYCHTQPRCVMHRPTLYKRMHKNEEVRGKALIRIVWQRPQPIIGCPKAPKSNKPNEQNPSIDSPQLTTSTSLSQAKRQEYVAGKALRPVLRSPTRGGGNSSRVPQRNR
ncbi:hypothetical protein EVAR_102321_1 [Eumeta japonica]|uniref:Nucleic-acid-binding protein from transposon X-element n=1 Tax=Eumeta variegata TaxID=151549 RepID=A0A4C1SDX9_EUMVA|nr:hypothetical protein EVAR_102321_1 [Eumeta japonica]